MKGREMFRSDDYVSDAEARLARNARARALRKAGYTVTCQTWDFTDLARARAYTLDIVGNGSTCGKVTVTE